MMVGEGAVQYKAFEPPLLWSFSRSTAAVHAQHNLAECVCVGGANLPTRLYLSLYLTVLVEKSPSGTDVHAYFHRQRVSKKYGNRDVNELAFVASKAQRWVVTELSFIDICIFQAISGAEVYSRSWLAQKVY